MIDYTICPVCKTCGVNVRQESNCKQCLSTFSPYQILEKLSSSSCVSWNYWPVLLLAILLGAFIYIFFLLRVPQTVTKPQIINTKLLTKPLIEPLQHRYVHILKQGECLSDVAMLYWKKSYLYPVLLELNPNLSLYHYKKGDTVIITVDENDAGLLYKNLIWMLSGVKYYRYVVQPKDTWNSINNRFFRFNFINKLKIINKNILKPYSILNIPLEQNND